MIGKKTFEVNQQFPGGVQQVFPGVEIVLLTTGKGINDSYKTVGAPEQALNYLEEKGFTEIIVGGRHTDL